MSRLNWLGMLGLLAVTACSQAGSEGPQGPAGPKGDKGDTGAVGAAGAAGPKGDRGDTGSVGAAGATGPQGEVGLQGAQGVAGAKGDTGEKGDKGEKGDTGPQGAPGTPPTAACTAGQAFCEGSRLWSCTRSGTDATGGNDCAADPLNPGTANNPAICADTACLPGSAACCRRQKALVSVVLTEPAVNSVLYGSIGANRATATGPVEICADDQGMVVNWSRPVATCNGSNDAIFLRMQRPFPGNGHVYTMPSGSVTVSVTFNADACANWTGTTTWSSDIPNWSVSMDLVCVGKPNFKMVGTISGSL